MCEVTANMQLAAVLFLFVLVAHLGLASGWSGGNAHTCVILNDLALNSSLWTAFYDSPAGTVLSVQSDGYTTVASHVKAPLVDGRTSVESFTLNRRSRFPVRAAMSSQWVLLEHPAAAHRSKGSLPVLLHCRLPLEKNMSDIQAEKERYILANEPLAQKRLMQWWARYAKEHPMTYGAGELMSRWRPHYILVPMVGLWRVQEGVLRSRMVSDGMKGSDEDVMAFMTSVRRNMARIRKEESDYRGVLRRVGSFHPDVSLPSWNREYNVWEMTYPAHSVKTPCHSHYSTLPNRTVSSTSSASQAQGGALHFWSTVIRFRCPDKNGPTDTITTWSIVPDRQMCRYYVELPSVHVCGWEYELDNLHVNPIPCARID